MFTKISVLVPTRGRVDRLRTMITSFDITTGGRPTTELVFRVDDDDIATRDFLLAWGGHRVIVGPRLNGYRSMPTFFNELALAASGDMLMCGNDDMVFQTLNWPEKILALANKFPDGVFDIGVSTLNASHYPFSIVSRKMVDAMGFLWDPRIFWGDIFLRDVAEWFGRAMMTDGVQIDHDWAGHNPDATFVQADKDIVRRTPDYWAGVHAPAVVEAAARVKEMIA